MIDVEPRGGGVMHVITGLGVGGAENMLMSLLLHNQVQKKRQRVLSLLPGGAHVQRLREAGVHVTELSMRPELPLAWQLLRLARTIWLERPDVIQSWMYHADLATTMALAWTGLRSQTRFYWGLRCSNMDPTQYGLRLRLVIRACAGLSQYPDAIVSNSEAGAKFHQTIGYRPKNMIVIDNGIDIDRFRPDSSLRAEVRAELGIDPNIPVIAHIARVDPMKDHRLLLDALAQLPQVVALLVGEGTKNLPAAPNAIRLGRRNDVPRLLAAADILVSSSAFGEGFSNAIAEGMATGLPAIATDVGDARRIVGDTGLIVPTADRQALVSAIHRLLAEPPEVRRGRSIAARQRIESAFPLMRAAERFSRLHAEGTG